MSRFNLFVSLIANLFTLFISANVQAQETTVVEKHVIISPVPKSVKCTTVSAHWEGNVWVDTQSVCTYENRTEGVAWVQDHWTCTVFTADGTCSTWQYKPGYWVKTYP